jgi:hypothetical protein
MNSIILLAEENKQLRGENERQKKQSKEDGIYSYRRCFDSSRGVRYYGLRHADTCI